MNHEAHVLRRRWIVDAEIARMMRGRIADRAPFIPRQDFGIIHQKWRG